jgi:riboflavin synthase
VFTGLIQEVGRVQGLVAEGQSMHLQIEAPRLAPLLFVGDSLAVNGVCLTVTLPGTRTVRVTAIAETLSRSTLGQIRVGSPVNLEPALRLGDRLGGHIVQGHVDGIGRVIALEPRGLSREMTIELPSELLRYLATKGSITIDGVSLTVAALTATTFTVALIPHTTLVTTLKERRIGDAVNLEVDILAKYVERMLGHGAPETAVPESEPLRSGLSLAALERHGFV